MDEFLSLDIFCNQYYVSETEKKLLRKPNRFYAHRSVQDYPFALRDGSNNTALYNNIERAFSFLFGNNTLGVLMGEFWAVIEDPGNSTCWGLFGLSEMWTNSKKQSTPVIHYALCPYNKRAMLSRAELIASLRRCSLTREWGHLKIDARKSDFSSGYLRSNALLEKLSTDSTMQLIYGGAHETEFSFWLDQIWKDSSINLQRLTCFFSYRKELFEVFAHNRFVLPQLLLFPGEPLFNLRRSNWKIAVPVRGTPRSRANIMTVSSVFGDNSYGLLLSGKALDQAFLELKNVPKSIGDSVRLPVNFLSNLLTPTKRTSESVQTSANQPYLLQTRNGYKIVIDHLPFWIGRNVGRDGFELPNNTMVSRRHAFISKKNGKYFITDNRAVNKTYINDTEVGSGKTVPLEDGSQLGIANEAFLFKLT